jgi:hypothetical protein
MHALSKPFPATALSRALASAGPGPGRSGTLPQTCDMASAITCAPMRRLARFEYNDTARDSERCMLDFRDKPHNDALVSILNLFGDTRTTYHHEEFCTGALAGAPA